MDRLSTSNINAMNVFCTIITSNYISYIKAQFQSLLRFNKKVQLYVLVCILDRSEFEKDIYRNLPDGIHLHAVSDICKEGINNEIFNKYYGTLKDEFRWSMKPGYMCYLFEMGIANKVIYIDWDIIFFNNYSFLFDDLNNNDIQLTPHWIGMCSSQTTDNENMKDLVNLNLRFSTGLYNAGFIGANKRGRHLLEWWAKACLYSCKKDANGLYDDQAYLNLLHLQSDKVGIVYHRGCNVAEWNTLECKRIINDNQVVINGEYPIVFIHFTNNLIYFISTGEDPFLVTYLNDYIQLYEEQNKEPLPYLAIVEKKKILAELKRKFETSLIGRIKYKTRIRTRIIKFMER